MTKARIAPVWLLTALLAVASSGCSLEYPACDTDSDCKDSEFCVNKQCQQCRADDDCGTGESCASGACEPVDGYCESAGDCGDGQDCEQNACVTARTTQLAPAPTPMSGGDGPCELVPIFFGYDSSSVETSARDQLASTAECIREKRLSAVHLTGLTDPRGTEEYNLALGDRRARSAQKYLESLGVEAHVTYSSMGEEYAAGTDERGWSQDRRVDVKAR